MNSIKEQNKRKDTTDTKINASQRFYKRNNVLIIGFMIVGVIFVFLVLTLLFKSDNDQIL